MTDKVRPKSTPTQVIRPLFTVQIFIDKCETVNLTDAEDEDVGEYYTCRVSIKGKNEHRDHYLVPLHSGPCSGDSWDKTQEQWQRQIEYIKNHLDDVLLDSSAHLCSESLYAGSDRASMERAFSTSTDLARFYMSFGNIEEPPIPYDSEFQLWVGNYAYEIKRRLTGEPRIRFDENDSTALSMRGGYPIAEIQKWTADAIENLAQRSKELGKIIPYSLTKFCKEFQLNTTRQNIYNLLSEQERQELKPRYLARCSELIGK